MPFRVVFFRDDKNYKLAVWDTAGQEKYLSITTAYFRGADGFLLVFDLSSADTFDKVGQWHATIKDNVPEAPVILVGNKSDLTEERTVAKESAQALADELGVQYFETSAKDNVNINEVFEALLNEMSPPPAEPEPPVEPAAEKPVAEKPAAEKPAAEKPVAEKPAAEKPAAEKPVAEKPAAEKPVAEKPVAKKPAAEKPDHVCLTDEQQPRQDKCAC